MKNSVILTCLSLIIILVLWVIWGNVTIETTDINIINSKIPEAFNGYTIVQISDLHNAQFGDNNKNLLNKIKNSSPDLIVITGDLVDSRHTDIKAGIDFAVKAQEIAPIYYVNGNHESRLSEYKEFENSLINIGVTVLRNESIELKRNNDKITITGIEDPAFYSINHSEEIIKDLLNNIECDHSYFNILLSHRPEAFEVYVENEFNLVFTGHAHGGQFRIPFSGGILAPGQGFFPKYDSGLYTEKDTSMIVSRGLGNSLFPFRLNNKPEIIVAKLNNKQ